MGLFPRERDLLQTPESVVLQVRASDYQLPRAELELRLDAFLGRHISWRSRSSIQELIRDGFVLVGAPTPDRPEGAAEPSVERRPGRRLHDGSTVVVVVPEEHRIPPAQEGADDLAVLFEDDHLLAVDKPAPRAVHPSGRHLSGTLIQAVQARYPEVASEPAHSPRILKLCHRLDRETSGVLLVGLERRAHRSIMRQFERREIGKEYLALVEGCPATDEGEIDLAIGSARVSQVHLKMAVRSDGLPSRTRWRLLETRPHCSLLSCEPMTGRQHQIRVHLAAMGHPVVGDKLYGADEEYFLRHARGELDEADRAALRLPRHALHNHRLSFTHPADGRRVDVTSPLPEGLAAFLRDGQAL